MFKIGKKLVGKNQPVFLIAEAGINHDGDVEKAKKLIDIAYAAKVDAVKFQIFSGERLASKDAMLATYHKKGTIKKRETLKELLKRLELSKDEFKELFNYSNEKGIMIFATPFGEEDADFLEDIGVKLFKIASFSLTNYPLLRHIAWKGKPIIMSTGLHNLGEIEEAVKVIREAGNKQLALLQCTSHYPSYPKDANLKVMDTLRSAFQVPVGYSDHTMGINITLASVAMGAEIVEKHFTFDTTSYGVDHDASISPNELKNLVKGIREIELAIGSSIKIIPDIEKEIQRVHRPSLVSKVSIPKGSIIKKNMITIKKPGTGIHPKDINWVIGRTTKNYIEIDRLIKREDLL